jgi:hypothetical protein
LIFFELSKIPYFMKKKFCVNRSFCWCLLFRLRKLNFFFKNLLFFFSSLK